MKNDYFQFVLIVLNRRSTCSINYILLTTLFFQNDQTLPLL